MRASCQPRPARAATAGLAIAVAFLLTAGARADTAAPRGETERLRASNTRLAAESQEALLELYALESRLGRTERRIDDLRLRAAEVERREASARNQLAVARADLGEAERRLESRLRTLYIDGEVDPLAVLLGAESLDEAFSALDGLSRVADQDQDIVAQLDRARSELRSALRELAARRAEIRALLVEAEAARSDLARARAERLSYLAELERRHALNSRQIGRLSDLAATAESRAQELSPSAAPTGAAPPASPAEPAEPGSTMTVHSTGYCLRGTTATGIPVGWGVVAVDPGVIPLGTRMTIPGYGEGVAADTGAAVRGAMIDLWFPSCVQAGRWGQRTVRITLH